MMRMVSDIMQADVITVTPDTTARELARLLEDEGVSGVPVKGPTGDVVGVVSASDLVRLAAEDGGEGEIWEADEYEPEDTENETASWSYFLAEEPPPRYVDLASEHGPDLDAFTVRDLMTPAPYTVTPATSLTELARLLLRNRIHRAVVVEDSKLVGIVTTLDVLRAVAAEPEPEHTA